jgi:hemoglobin-like flavoprotein
MKKYKDILNISYQRAVAPDYDGFFNRFYEILITADQQIAKLFKNTDMDRQSELLKQSMSYIISFASTLEVEEDMVNLALLHGRDNLNIPKAFYDTWLDSLIKTVSERDPKFDAQIETAWRVVMAPGLEYMKSFSD